MELETHASELVPTQFYPSELGFLGLYGAEGTPWTGDCSFFFCGIPEKRTEIRCLEPGTKLPWGRPYYFSCGVVTKNNSKLASTAYVPSGRQLFYILIYACMMLIIVRIMDQRRRANKRAGA